MFRVEIEFKYKLSGETRYELFEVDNMDEIDGVAAQFLKNACKGKYRMFYEDKKPEDFEMRINDVG